MTEEERAIDAYNRGGEANALRFEYFMKIMKAYDRFDFSELFDDLADGCRWGGAHGKEDVIRSLKAGAESMRERDYRHSCTIVEVPPAFSARLRKARVSPCAPACCKSRGRSA